MLTTEHEPRAGFRQKLLQAVNMDDWPHMVLYGISRPDELSIALRIATNLATQDPGGPVVAHRVDTVNNDLRVIRLVSTSYPLMILDVSQDSLGTEAFLRQCLGQRSCVHPEKRHVVFVTGLQRAPTKTAMLVQRMSDTWSNNALIIVIVNEISQVPLSIRNRFALLFMGQTAEESSEFNVQPPQEADEADSQLKTPVEKTPVEKTPLEKTEAGRLSPRSFLKRMPDFALAAEADVLFRQAGNWPLVLQYVLLTTHSCSRAPTRTRGRSQRRPPQHASPGRSDPGQPDQGRSQAL
jgi:hypothetical protein